MEKVDIRKYPYAEDWVKKPSVISPDKVKILSIGEAKGLLEKKPYSVIGYGSNVSLTIIRRKLEGETTIIPVVLRDMITAFGSFSNKGYFFVVTLPMEGAKISGGINVLPDKESLIALDATEPNYGRARLIDVPIGLIYGNSGVVEEMKVKQLWIYMCCRPVLHFYNEEGKPVIIVFENKEGNHGIPAGTLEIPENSSIEIVKAKSSVEAFQMLLKGLIENMQKGILKNKGAVEADEIVRDLTKIIKAEKPDEITIEGVGSLMLDLYSQWEQTKKVSKVVNLLRQLGEYLPQSEFTQPPIKRAIEKGIEVKPTGKYCSS